LAAILCDSEGLEPGDRLSIQVDEGRILNETRGIEKQFQPLPKIMRDILAEGGLDRYIRKYGEIRV
jgi:3-isopropylmalate/(R)-2-methylmalate dehydratase small subunit